MATWQFRRSRSAALFAATAVLLVVPSRHAWSSLFTEQPSSGSVGGQSPINHHNATLASCPATGDCDISTSGGTSGNHNSTVSWTAQLEIDVTDTGFHFEGAASIDASLGDFPVIGAPDYYIDGTAGVGMSRIFDLHQPAFFRHTGNRQNGSIILYRYPFGFDDPDLVHVLSEPPGAVNDTGYLSGGRYEYQMSAGAQARAENQSTHLPAFRVQEDSDDMQFDLSLEFEPVKASVRTFGPATVQRSSGDTHTFQNFNDDTYLQSGDSIKVPDNSFAIVHFYEGDHEVALYGNTTFTVTDENAITFNLKRGFIENFVNSLLQDRRYEGYTPHAVAAVRGTVFSMGYTVAGGQGTSTFSVDEGTVDVFDRATGQLLTTLGPGQTFSYTKPHVVPEPAACVLLCLAGIAAVCRRRTR
jgi:hypothetical protein